MTIVWNFSVKWSVSEIHPVDVKKIKSDALPTEIPGDDSFKSETDFHWLHELTTMEVHKLRHMTKNAARNMW